MQFPYKIPRYLNSPNFSHNVAEIPNLGTNSPKVGSLDSRDVQGQEWIGLDCNFFENWRMRTGSD